MFAPAAPAKTNTAPGNGATMPAPNLFFQPRLTINQPNDVYEQEADAMADRVMRMPAGNDTFFKPSPLSISRLQKAEMELDEDEKVQRQCATCDEKEHEVQRHVLNNGKENKIQRQCAACEEENKKVQRHILNTGHENKIQRKCSACEAKEKLQRKESTAAETTASPSTEGYIRGLNGSGSPLSGQARGFFEPRFGYDFSSVRVHTDSIAAKSADSVNALAYTHGNNIVFNQNQFSPETSSGQRLLAHELTHVVQQGNGIYPKIQRNTSDDSWFDTATNAFTNTLSSVGSAVIDTGAAIAGTASGAGSLSSDWLAGTAGQLASRFTNSFGGLPTITSSGIEIHIDRFCPIGHLPFNLPMPGLEESLTVPVVALPIAPNAAITGALGVSVGFNPGIQLSLGPLCVENLHILINPITSHYSIRGSLTAEGAMALESELRGGIRGEVNLDAIVPVGGVPIPIEIPLVGAEGGLAGMVRASGAGKIIINGGLDTNNEVVTIDSNNTFNIGLAADAFAGAYVQLDALGINLCRLYWQPWEWHGDVGASLAMSANVNIIPGSPPIIIPDISAVSLEKMPFDEITQGINRGGFSDQCAIKDKICEIMAANNLFPSQRGGNWNETGTGQGGDYGPGVRLDGPLEVYTTDPGIASEALCRGACGPNCYTCEDIGIKQAPDPITGQVTEYTGFKICNSHEGCREHDAGFDWAADEQGEKGTLEMIMPWHMAANLECACNYPAGNCVGWIAGMPPYDRTMFFADESHPLTGPKLPTIKPNTLDGCPEGMFYSPDSPTGLGSDHILITWFKPLSVYENPIIINGEEFDMTTQNQPLPPPFHDTTIGVDNHWLPEVGKEILMFSERNRRESRRFITRLLRAGFTWNDSNGQRLSPDHVQDLMWNGPDEFENLWPLESRYNERAGIVQNIEQLIEFRPDKDSPCAVRLPIGEARQLYKMNRRRFEIDSIKKL